MNCVVQTQWLASLLWSLGWAFSSARKERGISNTTDKAMVEMGLQEKMEMADFAKMEKVRARADSVVDNSRRQNHSSLTTDSSVSDPVSMTISAGLQQP